MSRPPCDELCYGKWAGGASQQAQQLFSAQHASPAQHDLSLDRLVHKEEDERGRRVVQASHARTLHERARTALLDDLHGRINGPRVLRPCGQVGPGHGSEVRGEDRARAQNGLRLEARVHQVHWRREHGGDRTCRGTGDSVAPGGADVSSASSS